MGITITNTFIFIALIFGMTLSHAAESEEYRDAAKQRKMLDSVPAPAKENPAAPAATSKRRIVRRKKVVQEEVVVPNELSFNVGGTVWGEQILLQTADGREEEVQVDYTGVKLGMGYVYRWESTGWNLGVDTMLLQGDAQTPGQDIIYQSKTESVTPVFAWTGLYFYPQDKVNFGFDIGAVFYKVKLNAPTSVVTSYDFKYSNVLQACAKFHLGWKLSESTLFQQEIFVTQDTVDRVGWSVSIGYIF